MCHKRATNTSWILTDLFLTGVLRGKMLVFGFILVAFGASAAIDLSGCKPSKAKVFGGRHQLTGEITSPGYSEGEEYPNDLVCEYLITAPKGLHIKLTFEDMDIEPSDMCMHDAVEIAELDLNERQPQRYPLGVYCGNQTYPPIISRSNTDPYNPFNLHAVSILFRSDFMIRHRGFRIKFVLERAPSLCKPRERPCGNGNCFKNRDMCDGKDDCGDGTDEMGCGFPLPAFECGIRKVSGNRDSDRVIGGQEAVPGSWPWQADLQLSIIYPNGHSCGGTLIHPQWVLSAAHCFQEMKLPGMWRIHLGNHHKFIKDDSEQIRWVERIILYPGTTGMALLRLLDVDMENDIALVKLNAPVNITDSVRPACLPTQGHELPLGTKCMASGWGISRGTGSNHVLKEVDLTVQKGDLCYGDMGPINPETMICVKNEKGYQDVCHGDSGGPLACELDGKWHVMGSTSYGSEGNMLGGLCAMTDSGTIYSKVSHKTNWIRSMINRFG